MNSPVPPTEIQLQEVLRLRRAALHEQIDEQMDQLCLELGIQPPTSTPTIGMSFEPRVLFEYVPPESHEAQLGFYETRVGRTVEVVTAQATGKVFFEVVDSAGQICTRSVDQELFHQLFRHVEGLQQPDSQVRYGVHPIYQSVALRYNPDGSITRGRFAADGEFLADE